MIVSTVKQFEKFIKLLAQQQEVGFDTETTGLNVWGEDRMCGIGFSFRDGTKYYLPFRHKLFDDHMTLLKLMEDMFEDYNLPLDLLPQLWSAMVQIPCLIGHNIKFDLAVISRDGYVVPTHQIIEETLIGARLYFPDKHPDMSLENVTKEMQGTDESAWKAEFKKYLHDRGIENHYDRAEIPVIAEYCESDCANTVANRDKLCEFARTTSQWELYETELHVIKILWDMERVGLRVDKKYLADNLPYLREVVEGLHQKLFEITGEKFNPNSSTDVNVQMNKLGIKSRSHTAKGAPQWNEEVLKKTDHPIAPLILAARAVEKLVDTYFVPYLALDGNDVHCTFKSWGTVTGRLSCVNPNLQQVSRNVDYPEDLPALHAAFPEFDVQVRKMFVPPDGFKMVCMDFSQMEMLVYSDYLEDEALRAKLRTGTVDFHSLVAKMIWKVDEEHPKWKAYRIAAKCISLGLVYGMGLAKLAGILGVTEDVARKYREEYFKAFPTAPAFQYKVKQTIEQRGFVFNRFGRRYYLPPEKSYAAINYLVQGSSADIIKLAMIRIDRLLKGRNTFVKPDMVEREGTKIFEAKHHELVDRLGHPIRSRLALQMHDEFDSYIAEDEFDIIVPAMHEAMEYQEIQTFLPVDISMAAPNWSEKVNICRDCYKIKEKTHVCQKSVVTASMN